MTTPAAAQPSTEALVASPAAAAAPEHSGRGTRPADWLVAGARSAVLRPTDWQAMTPSPTAVLVVVAFSMALSLLLQRLYVDGPAYFNLPALDSGWLQMLMVAAACLLVLPGRALGAFVLLMAQEMVIGEVTGGAYAVLIQAGWSTSQVLPDWAWPLLWYLPVAWSALATLGVFWRALPGQRAVALVTTGVLALAWWQLPQVIEPQRFWYPVPAERPDAPKPFALTQAVMERQIEVIAGQLQGLQPQRPGVVDLYVLTFAPYGEEDVFRRESAMVADVMQQRFDAAGRTLQLVNHRGTWHELPWATPVNLQRAIARVAQLMDPEEDVLFIHLTSHGARDGKLATRFVPMSVETLDPTSLKGWLDGAGIRHRVVSISACFSGSWIAPLAGDGTLVMTAADAEHTSYGCGRLSELTFYGRAVFDEQLRSHTLSFEQALAAARPVIDQREREAGKSDGYSNPQISPGPAIRDKLMQLEVQLRARQLGAAAALQ